MLGTLKILLLNQTFDPDVVASAQYLTQLARALTERGHVVTVVTGRRAYDDPGKLFPTQETRLGIKIYRVASTAFGKVAKWRRAVDFGSFFLSCSARLVRLPRQDVVVALTSPPLVSFLAAWLARLRRSRFVYWVMDFNPDEAIAAGWLQPGSLAARVLDSASCFSLRQAHKVIALDRFMRDRILNKGVPEEKVVVLAPWSQDDQVRFDAAGREQFRARHGLQGKFVVMYAGNHSPIHPLDTVLEAAKRLAQQPDVVFCFIGGGSEFQRVQRLAGQGSDATKTSSLEPRTSDITRHLPNAFCLPYQPLEQLSAMLSAADAQVVVMGNAFVGLVHPCKIYNILRVGSPVLYVGPQPSHVSEILDAMGGQHFSARAAHGDVESLVRGITNCRDGTNAAQGRVRAQVISNFCKDTLLPRLVAELESA